MERLMILDSKIINTSLFGDMQLFRLWMILLANAAYKEERLTIAGRNVKVMPGQWVTTRIEIMKIFNDNLKKKFHVGDSTIWRWLRDLQNKGLIKVKGKNKYSIITISHWDYFWDGEDLHDKVKEAVEKRK